MAEPMKPFTITVVLSGRAQTGGGYHQALTSLRMFLDHVPRSFRIRVLDEKNTFSEGLTPLLKEGRLQPEDISRLPRRLPTFRDRVVVDSRLIYKFMRWILKLRGIPVRSGTLARYLDTSDTDLVYFLGPTMSASELQQKPYIWTLWDLCHLDSPEFPEVRTSGKFEARDEGNSRNLRKAALIVVDSTKLEMNVRNSYGITADKFVTIPFSPPRGIAEDTEQADNLPPTISSLSGKYFFYPAQLWTHKNHLRIVEAIQLLDQDGHDVHAVFVGKDHGAGATLRKNIASSGINQRIHFLGYVDDAQIPSLYRQSLGLVMASYFGPTNIPPLEALTLGVPVIASRQHTEQLGDAALYFDPDSAIELAAAMKQVQKEKVKTTLATEGRKLLIALETSRKLGYQTLSQRIEFLEKRLIR